MSDPKKTALAIAIQANVPVLLWGAPGTGKTSAIVQLGEEHGLPVETVIASIRDPTDFSGLPIPTDNGVILAPPKWAQNLARQGKGILFLDELSTAPPAVQAALLRVVLEKTVGDLTLPSEVRIIAAANPPDQAAGGWDLSLPLANRFLHLNWDPLTAQEYAEAIVTGTWPVPNGVGTLPEGWEKNNKYRNIMASFIRSHPNALLALPKEDSKELAWPSPRSWEMCLRLLTAADALKAPDNVRLTLIQGSVGSAYGMEFFTYISQLDLPDPEEILAHESYKLSKRGDVNYLVLLSVVDAVANKLTDERVISAWKVLSDVATQGGEDVGIVAATRMGRLTGPHLITAVKDYLMSYKTVLAMVSKSVTAKTRTPK